MLTFEDAPCAVPSFRLPGSLAAEKALPLYTCSECFSSSVAGSIAWLVSALSVIRSCRLTRNGLSVLLFRSWETVFSIYLLQALDRP